MLPRMPRTGMGSGASQMSQGVNQDMPSRAKRKKELCSAGDVTALRVVLFFRRLVLAHRSRYTDSGLSLRSGSWGFGLQAQTPRIRYSQVQM